MLPSYIDIIFLTKNNNSCGRFVMLTHVCCGPMYALALA